MGKSDVDVGVSVVTYNHAPFIAQTLEGILNQRTRYSMVVHVGDDGSNDSTREIVASYAERYPELVVPHFHQSKLGIRDNFMSTIESCRARYVAICDGDDLWTDPLKLERQVSALDARPQFSTSFHSAQVVDRAGVPQLIVPQRFQVHGDTYGLADLVRNESFFATSSIVFRRPEGPIFPDWFDGLQNIVDLPMNMVNAGRGPMLFIDEMMCMYRSNSSAHAFSARDPIAIWVEAIGLFELLSVHLDDEFRDDFRAKQSRNWREIIVEYASRGAFSEASRAQDSYEAWAVGEGLDVTLEARSLRKLRRVARALPRKARRRGLRFLERRSWG